MEDVTCNTGPSFDAQLMSVVSVVLFVIEYQMPCTTAESRIDSFDKRWEILVIKECN